MPYRFPTLVAAFAGVFLVPGVVAADVLYLAQGGRLEGVLVRETATRITIDVGMGEVSVPRNRVLRVERKESALSEYRRRLMAIQPGDVAALEGLARFAGDQGLRSEARVLWARVSALAPGNVEAHLALGHVLVGGQYLDEDEAYRAKGLVNFDGRWMTQAEQASLLREREESARDRRRADEARRAAREAEDSARRAEAARARARADAERAAPYPSWGYGGTILVGSPHWGGYTAGCATVNCGTVPPIWPAPAPPPSATPLPRAAPVRPSSIR